MILQKSQFPVAALAVSCCIRVFAADILGGFGEVAHVDVAADVVAQDGAVLVSPEATGLVKSGTGTWNVPVSCFFFGLPGNLFAGAGTLALDAEPATVALPDATAICRKAAFWVDASLSPKDGTGDDVDVWYDVRDTGRDAYPRAVYDETVSKSKPTSATYGGKDALYFGGYGAASRSANGNGASMKWCDPDGTARRFSGIRHLFAVHGVDKTYGFIFGDTVNNHFHIGFQSSALSPTYWRNSGSDGRQAASARNFVDGKTADAYRDTVPTGRHLLELDMMRVTGSANNFFNDRNYCDYTKSGGDRTGGDYLHEVLVFTNALTEAERVQVEAYLMDKWGISAPAADATVTVAPQGRFEVASATLMQDGFSVAGTGTISPVEGTGGEIPVQAAVGESVGVSLADGQSVNLRLARAVEIHAGDMIDSARGRTGDTLVRTAGGDAGTVSKTGTGSLTIRELPSSTTNFNIQAGEVRLVPGLKSSAVTGEDGIIPNGSFEEGDWTQGDTIAFLGKTVNGWTATAPSSNYRNEAFFYNVTDGTTAARFNGTLYTNDIPEGCCVMAVKHDVSVGTTVTLQSDGVYALSFWTSGRGGTYGGRQHLDLAIGATDDTLETFATVVSSYGPWVKHSYQLPELKAGSYRLWFKSRNLSDDRLALIDDMRLAFVSPGDGDSVFPVPNGAFEILEAPLAAPQYFRASNAARGWTFTQPDGADDTKDAYVGLAMPDMSTTTISYFDQAGNVHGDANLAFLRAGGIARCNTFALPAGTWRLAADAAKFGITTDAYGDGLIAVTATIDGVEKDIGAIDIVNRKRTTFRWPVTVTNATAVQVSLALAQTQAAYVTVDNLRFERVAGDELIVNGSFENGEAGWTFAKNVRGGYEILPYAQNPTRYGAEACDGEKCLRIVFDESASQTVAFPAAGLYRMSFCAHMRWDSLHGWNSRGFNPVRAWWTPESGVTNIIGYTEPADRLTLSCCSNFVEYAFTFRVPDAGSYTVGIQGVVDNAAVPKATPSYDSEVCVDRVSLRKIDEDEIEETPDLPEDLAISVAEGARLRLDFGGTNAVDSVRFAGRFVGGVVSEETCPAFVSGPGALLVKRYGAAIIIR